MAVETKHVERAKAILSDPKSGEQTKAAAREVLAKAGVVVPLPKAPDPLARWNLLSLAELAAPLPPIPWVNEAIGLAPGAVSMVAGYGYSRKTMAMQSLGLSVASGKPLWGVWRTRKGPFVHLDYEQGRRLTPERYQRLARGMGFELADLEPGALRVACMPLVYLDENNIYDDLVRIVDGAAFVLVDSLRAAFPGADENSSEVRYYLDVLTRVSERTGAAIAVIHHAGKPNAQASTQAKHAPRGSSALFDACQSVYVFSGEKDAPTLVKHEKDRVRGKTFDDFAITSEDVESGGDPRWGLRVVHLDLEQLEDAASQRVDAKREAAIERAAEGIIATISAHGGGLRGTRRDVRTMVRDAAGGVANEVFDAAWMRLVGAGILVQGGSKREPTWSLNANGPAVPNGPEESRISEGERSRVPVLLKYRDRSHALSRDERSRADELDEQGELGPENLFGDLIRDEGES